MIPNIPQWLEILLGEKFFMPCMVHKHIKKNEKNIFCLDCCTSLCPHCLPTHRPHSLLQIRRYVYHDVIQLDDAQKLIDCSLVQTYTTNSAKVVFLNQRPISRPFRASSNLCIKCDRSLQNSFLFCSLFCKVYHLVTMKNGTHLEKLNCEFLRLPNRTRSHSFSKLEDNQNVHDSGLDSPVSLSGSTSSTIGGVSSESLRTILPCSAATKFVKKKRSSLNSVPREFFRQICSPADDVAVAMNRRKGVPYRSPLY
ncbi:protein RGF1 INDUCIBLE TRANSCRIPTION FACTOR 1-like [Ziziphus jujuba]|uniref:Protein RGF1 INDUCIBLE TRANSCRIPTION FACTOR 1-like n=1 Tax=Ziziphus jujuba TaxID=326968 RepID=A0A6P6FLY9_ZIZJJ|nr:protein RGF1 INDUCIBLE TRANSCRIPTION FACTOR 1-like [Ziziphus jujuba]